MLQHNLKCKLKTDFALNLRAMFLRNRVKMILLIVVSLVLIDFPDASSAEMIQNIQKCGKSMFYIIAHFKIYLNRCFTVVVSSKLF